MLLKHAGHVSPDPHELASTLGAAVSRLGQALVSAIALIGIALMMRGTEYGEAWLGAVIAAVSVWLAIVLWFTGKKTAPRQH